MNSTDSKPKSKAEREAEEKARRRAEAATIVAGLKQALDGDEQLLGFARGRLAGGIRGKMSLGPEAFFAPYVNVGLTERRLVIQHINAETGRPGEILPHYYALGDIAAMNFSDIETFGGEAAARLTVRLQNEQHTRLRLRGQTNFESAQAIVEVFRSLTLAQRPRTTPTQRICATCQHILDQPFKFCPYCGQQQDLTASAPPAATEAPERTYPPTPPGPTEPEFLDTVPYQDASAFRGPTVEDGLEFLAPAPAPVLEPTVTTEPTTASEPIAVPGPMATPEPAAAPEPEASAAPAQDSAFETPSHFEGWSVEPEAASAAAEPAAVVEAAVPTPENAVEPVQAGGYEVETEASVAEPTPEAAVVPVEPVANADYLPEVPPLPETAATTFHPEAEFAAVPEPAHFAPAPTEGHEPVAFDASPTETAPVVPAGLDAPPPAESYSEAAAHVVHEQGDVTPPEPLDAIPSQESAGFVTVPVAAEVPTPVEQDFAAFAPVAPMPSVPAFAASPETPEPAAAASPGPAEAPSPTPDPIHAAAVPPAVPEPAAPTPAPSEPFRETPVVPSPSEYRFAALLKEIRGGDAPPQHTTPLPAPERKDGPMRVQVHIDRPPIKVNEGFDGRNADEVVGKLKQRVLPELNFALRLMVNSFSNLRFAQEIVRRYNDREKTSYPVPNSCWEFLQSAEKMGYATIHINS